jgi:hypothetical protein
MEKNFENEFATYLIKEDIFFVDYKQGIVLNLESAQLVVADRIKMQNKKSYLILCDVRGIVDYDKDARDYLAQHGSALAKAVGIVVDQRMSSFMISYYIKISKPQVPTEFFTDRLAALEFLKTFV